MLFRLRIAAMTLVIAIAVFSVCISTAAVIDHYVPEFNGSINSQEVGK